jgi:hypothetical protein
LHNSVGIYQWRVIPRMYASYLFRGVTLHAVFMYLYGRGVHFLPAYYPD